MTVTLSMFAGAGAQFFDDSGVPLSGGKIYTYNAGTTTPYPTYTTANGQTARSNPIILDAAGRVPGGGEIWLSNGVAYKFILKNSADVLIQTLDNIPSSAQPPVSNDASSIFYAEGYTVTAGNFIVGQTYKIETLGDTNFTLIGATVNEVGIYFIATGVGAGTGTAKFVRTVEQKLQETISVKDFGAIGDGVANDTAAIQAAIDNAYANGGGTVIIPDGTYNVEGVLAMKSNVTVNCQAGAIIDFNNSSSSTVISFTGTAGSEFAFTAAATVGDTTVTLGGSPSFAVNDLVHFISVRNALSRADAGTFWLGDGTISLPYAFYAEFNYIAENLGGGQYRLAKPFIYPGYEINASGETETNRTTSAAQLVTPCENAHWIGGIIRRDEIGANLITGTWAVNCSVKDCEIFRGRIKGNTIVWAASFQCEGKNILHHNDPSLDFVYANDHADYNRFKTVGSQDCGFIGLNESYGGQSVDFTYGSTGLLFCNTRSYCRDGLFSHLFEELTSHPGCYQESFVNNEIVDCYTDGIVVRGYEPVITGNIITSTRQPTADLLSADINIGIGLAYGATRRAFVSGNTVRGFYYAFRILGSTTLEWYWENCLINICNNEVSECFTGLYSTLSSASENDFLRFITYNNNNHSAMGRFVVDLEEYNAGVTITNNTMNGGFRYTGTGAFVAFVAATNNCPALTIKDNVWLRTKGTNPTYTKYFAVIASITDTIVYPAADWEATTYVGENYVTFENDANFTLYSIAKGSAYYQSISNPDATYTYDIVSGEAKAIPTLNRIYQMIVDTEGAAATDNLDTISAANNCVLKQGDILYLRIANSARDVVVRDLSVAGGTSNIQTPGNASITLDSSNSILTLLYTDPNWCIVTDTLA